MYANPERIFTVMLVQEGRNALLAATAPSIRMRKMNSQKLRRPPTGDAAATHETNMQKNSPAAIGHPAPTKLLSRHNIFISRGTETIAATGNCFAVLARPNPAR